VFVGPTPESIRDMQKRRMIDDLSALLSRHFGDAEIGEVTALVNQLFTRGGARRRRTGLRSVPAVFPEKAPALETAGKRVRPSQQRGS